MVVASGVIATLVSSVAGAVATAAGIASVPAVVVASIVVGTVVIVRGRAFLSVGESLSDVVEVQRFAEYLVGTLVLGVVASADGTMEFNFLAKSVDMVARASLVVSLLATACSVLSEEFLLHFLVTLVLGVVVIIIITRVT